VNLVIDASYLALAKRNQAKMLTADEKLRNKASKAPVLLTELEV